MKKVTYYDEFGNNTGISFQMDMAGFCFSIEILVNDVVVNTIALDIDTAPDIINELSSMYRKETRNEK